MCSFWLSIHSTRIPSHTLASVCRRTFFALLGTILLLSPFAARADIFDVTFTNVTFTGPCVGGGICTETINGSGFYDSVANVAWDIGIQLTGTLNTTLDVYGAPPQCTAPACLQTPVLYDANALAGFNPIEFAPNLDLTIPASTPQPIPTGPNGALFFIPGMCGGDIPACNTTGAFQGNGAVNFDAASGTYTAVDLGPSPVPEPGTLMLLATGAIGGLRWMTRRSRSTAP